MVIEIINENLKNFPEIQIESFRKFLEFYLAKMCIFLILRFCAQLWKWTQLVLLVVWTWLRVRSKVYGPMFKIML